MFNEPSFWDGALKGKASNMFKISKRRGRGLCFFNVLFQLKSFPPPRGLLSPKWHVEDMAEEKQRLLSARSPHVKD